MIYTPVTKWWLIGDQVNGTGESIRGCRGQRESVVGKVKLEPKNKYLQRQKMFEAFIFNLLGWNLWNSRMEKVVLGIFLTWGTSFFYLLENGRPLKYFSGVPWHHRHENPWEKNLRIPHGLSIPRKVVQDHASYHNTRGFRTLTLLMNSSQATSGRYGSEPCGSPFLWS